MHLFTNKKSQFDVLEHFSSDLQKALIRQGVKSNTYDILEQAAGDVLPDFLHNPPDCTFGFNITLSKDFFLGVMDVPHVAIYVDSATYHHELLECPNIIGCFTEEDSIGFLQTLNRSNTLFFPHAINESDLLEKKAMQESGRDYDIVMTGTLYDPEYYLQNWDKLFSGRIISLLKELSDRVLNSADLSPLRAFCQEVQPGDKVDSELKQKGIARYIVANSLEQYTRARERLHFIESIHNYDIHIFGPENEHRYWREIFPEKKRLFLHNPVPYNKLPELFRRTKVVINSAPMIKHGAHERLLLALSQGASVLTSDNVFIGRNFPETEAVMRVLKPDFSELDALVASSLSDPEKRFNAIMKTHETIKEEFTWDVRAKMLIQELPRLLAGIK